MLKFVKRNRPDKVVMIESDSGEIFREEEVDKIIKEKSEEKNKDGEE